MTPELRLVLKSVRHNGSQPESQRLAKNFSSLGRSGGPGGFSTDRVAPGDAEGLGTRLQPTFCSPGSEPFQAGAVTPILRLIQKQRLHTEATGGQRSRPSGDFSVSSCWILVAEH